MADEVRGAQFGGQEYKTTCGFVGIIEVPDQ
jgi:hypothetical protein